MTVAQHKERVRAEAELLSKGDLVNRLVELSAKLYASGVVSDPSEKRTTSAYKSTNIAGRGGVRID